MATSNARGKPTKKRRRKQTYIETRYRAKARKVKRAIIDWSLGGAIGSAVLMAMAWMRGSWGLFVIFAGIGLACLAVLYATNRKY